jgi:hypothetical protein
MSIVESSPNSPLNSQFDLETGNMTVPGGDQLVPPQMELTKIQQICLKMCVAFLVCTVISPFVICDLYFAFTDETCVHQPIQKLQLNMYSYLIVSGVVGLLYMIFLQTVDYIVVYDSPRQDDDLNEIILFGCTVAQTLFNLFTISWTVVGCVIFWGYMNNSECSEEVYNYLFAKFVISSSAICLLLLKGKN